VKSRCVCRDPVRASIEVHEHRRIAACGDNPIRDRSLLKLITSQKFGPLGALDAVFSIEDVGRPAIGIAHGPGIWQGFDQISSLPAVVAIADTAYDRPAELSSTPPHKHVAVMMGERVICWRSPCDCPRCRGTPRTGCASSTLPLHLGLNQTRPSSTMSQSAAEAQGA
jgi:hypothetical protein